MCSKSRRVRLVNLTRYAMLRAEFVQGFSRGLVPAALQILHALTNALSGIGARRDVQQALVVAGVLYDRFRLAVHREDYRPLALLELLHELARLAPERGKGLNILGEIEPRMFFQYTTLKIAGPSRTTH